MIKRILLLSLLVALVFGLVTVSVKADCGLDSGCWDKLISGYQDQITTLQGQANTLSNQIAQFDAQINLTELKIDQTQENIVLLGGRIDQLEVSLQSLTKAFSARAVETYKMSRSAEEIYLLLSSQSPAEIVSRFNYLQRVQSSDRDLLVRLQGAQNTYKQNKDDSQKLEAQLEDQKTQLANQKAAKNQLLAVTQNDEKKYQQLLSEAIAQKNAFLNFVSSHGGASILNNQTVCDGWGCYYNQRDSLWGNHGLGISDLSVAEYGCLVSSSAMIAKHYGRDIKPIDIAVEPSAFFSNTGLLNYNITVKGINIRRTSLGATTANIDNELSSGRPVIIGLYGGPAHFIVLKSGSNGNYIMNDPFLENGHDKNFTDKYKVSDITDVEQVSVQ